MEKRRGWSREGGDGRGEREQEEKERRIWDERRGEGRKRKGV